MSNPSSKVIVGMSGGVDSSVAALLLKQQGHDVHGVFMQNWDADRDDPYCTVTQDQEDAHRICQQLEIPFESVQFVKQYWDHVFKYFLDEYSAGRTPNPDILCNKEIKFKAFLNYAIEQGADYIATGHYVQTQSHNGNLQLLKAHDLSKDQSYFLYTLNQSQLEKSLFPLGNLTKKTVREIAKQHNFINHAKKDSTGICFIGERKFKEFLSEYVLARPGNIETTDGNIIGKHSGLMFYTLGQRQGLGIGGMKNTDNAPWYVLQKDLDRNVLIVGQSHDHPLLYKNSLECNQVHWIEQEPIFPLFCSAKTRYRQQDEACKIIKKNEDTLAVEFEQPQWAITPGQSVVFYKDNICLGGGIIL